jgi:hypothetical protein
MRLQVLPGSSLPDQLAALGYIAERTGETQRILPHAVSQDVTTTSSGAFIRCQRRLDAPGDGAHHGCRDRDRGAVRSANSYSVN